MDHQIKKSDNRTCTYSSLHGDSCFYFVKHKCITRPTLTSVKGFYDPVNEKMFEPPLTGFSYSFTDDGHYEEAFYRAISNRGSLISTTGLLVGYLTFCSCGPSMPKRNHTMAAWHIREECERLPQSYTLRR